MKNRCDGCGVKIQTVDKTKPGYIRSEVYLKNPDDFLCERCFNLIHYNRLVDVEYDSDAFYKTIDYIAKGKGIVVNVVDGFDLEGTIIPDVNKHFPRNKILLVVNKFDLFLSSTKPSKIRNYIKEYLQEHNIVVDDICIMSSKKSDDIKMLINKIERLFPRREKEVPQVFFFGIANVGKSTLINAIIKYINYNTHALTTSNLPGTTLDIVKLILKSGVEIYDTPGIINKNQYTYYLTKETLNQIIPQKYIKPRTYQLLPGQSIFVGNFIIIKFPEGDRINLTLNFSNAIYIHRTKIDNIENIRLNHQEDLLKLPTLDELNALDEITKKKEITFEVEDKMEIAISGLGFIGATGNGTLIVEAPDAILVTSRKPLI